MTVKNSSFVATVISCALLVGCADPVKDAEDRYEIVKRTGDKKEICLKGRELQDAYLAKKDEGRYREQKLASDIECQSWELDR